MLFVSNSIQDVLLIEIFKSTIRFNMMFSLNLKLFLCIKSYLMNFDNPKQQPFILLYM